MEVLLIRHGDPDYANDCLTAVGKKEAQCLADAMDQHVIDNIYVSPRGRAQETCRYTASQSPFADCLGLVEGKKHYPRWKKRLRGLLDLK